MTRGDDRQEMGDSEADLAAGDEEGLESASEDEESGRQHGRRDRPSTSMDNGGGSGNPGRSPGPPGRDPDMDPFSPGHTGVKRPASPDEQGPVSGYEELGGTLLTIDDRIVRIDDPEHPPSLYSMMRSWLHNDPDGQVRPLPGTRHLPRLPPSKLPAPRPAAPPLPHPLESKKPTEAAIDAAIQKRGDGEAAPQQPTAEALLKEHAKRWREERAWLLRKRIAHQDRYGERMAALVPADADGADVS
ncbi:unnamed protein product [Pedinophyceae sp. YPF-701]|nr:unnamed protein product [Pedinophyceae sp. YPF-701]